MLIATGMRIVTGTDTITDIPSKEPRVMLDSTSGPLPPSGELAYLQLLHLADSALPIGSLSHSFGLETLIAAGILQVADLRGFLSGYLQEAGTLEAAALREAFALATGSAGEFSASRWIALNELLSALKPARETRAASATLGRNFLRAAMSVSNSRVLREAAEAAAAAGCPIHQSTAFGLAGAALGFAAGHSTLAYLHQMTTNLVSACQRLMPLGQTEAMRILWELKATIVDVSARSAEASLETVSCTTPLLDWGAMEHPALTTRLFVS